jgi:hypothetical protein
MVEIEKQLKALRLNGMLATLESRVLQVNQGNVAFIEGLSWLLQDEGGLPLFRFKTAAI